MGELSGTTISGTNLAADATARSKPPKPAPSDGDDMTRHGVAFDEKHSVEEQSDIKERTGVLNIIESDSLFLGGRTHVEGTNRWGLVGSGDTTIRTPKRGFAMPLTLRISHGLVLDDLTFDLRDDRETGMGVNAAAGDALELHNLRFVGKQTDEERAPGFEGGTGMENLLPHVTSDDGTGHVSNLEITAHGEVRDYPTGCIPVYMGPSHRGTLHVDDPHIETSAMHTFYASRTRGEVHVDGGLLKNNSNTNMRLSGRSTVKNAKVVLDAPRDRFVVPGEHTRSGEDEGQSTEGIWWERMKWNGSSGGLIENVDLEVTSEVPGQGLIQIDGSCGEVTIRDCDLYNTTDDYHNIMVDEVGSNVRDIEPPGADWVRVEGCSLSGSGRRPLVKDHRGTVEVS
ncbi:hypothetical protein [Halococcus sp. AFM35]|uniref:hypothetical protein n=1 Tax=Halococcus sp. AFM35 TaxID=3421653 RepID=UPI003EC00C73